MIRFWWQWSLVITVPVVVFSALLAMNTWSLFLDVGIRQIGDKGLPPLTLWNAGHIEFDYLTRRFWPIPKASGFRQISLFASKSDLESLNENLPVSGSHFIPGIVQIGDDSYQAKLKYRGDYHQHWSFHKKSFRIKTRKKNLLWGMREINLIVPKTSGLLNNYLSYRIAESLGIMTPYFELVTVLLNGEYQGIYLLTEQVNEGLLRRNGRLPGDIYSGDQIFGQDKWSGVGEQLFDHEGLWDKVSINNKFAADHNLPLKKLIATLNSKPGTERTKNLAELVDVRAFARFSAMEALLSTGHHDAQHNWKLYFDPIMSRFMPIAWDSLGFNAEYAFGGMSSLWRDADSPPLDIINNKLTLALYEIPSFQEQHYLVIRKFYADGIDQQMLTEFDRLQRKLDPMIASERLAVDRNNERINHQMFKRAGQKIRQSMVKIFDANRPTSPIHEHSIISAHEFETHVTDRTPISGVTLTLSHEGAPTSIDLVVSTDGIRESSRKVPFTQKNNFVHIKQTIMTKPLISLSSTGQAPVEHIPATYHFHLRGLDNGTKITDVANIELSVSKYPARPTQIWSGELNFDQSITVPDNVTIVAGTTISIAKDVHLIFTGRLDIQGTKANTVKIYPAKATQPWGTLTLRGEGANGSSLNFFEMSGGSLTNDGLSVTSGMLSLHQVEDVDISNCYLFGNYLGDDMIHAAYSKLRVSHCKFDLANMDAVDLDMSQATIDTSQFTRSGNDGLDLMGSEIVVTNSYFSNNGDKGISAGEDTNLLSQSNTFNKNSIAIEVKEKTRATIQGNKFSDNQVAIHLYKKNWYYGVGADVLTCDNEMTENTLDIEKDKHSSITEHCVP